MLFRSVSSAPNVPTLPGVPDLPGGGSAASGVTTIQSGTSSSTQTATSKKLEEWALLRADGSPVIVADTYLEYSYRGDAKIANYPVEGGSFASYNKVILPYDIRLTAFCSGYGEMNLGSFLNSLNNLKKGLELVTLVTQFEIYENLNLIHVDHKHNATNNANTLTVLLFFQEVRQAGVTTITTVMPDGADAVNLGQVSLIPPTPTQAATVASAADIAAAVESNSAIANLGATVSQLTPALAAAGVSAQSLQIIAQSGALASQAAQLSGDLSAGLSPAAIAAVPQILSFVANSASALIPASQRNSLNQISSTAANIVSINNLVKKAIL